MLFVKFIVSVFNWSHHSVKNGKKYLKEVLSCLFYKLYRWWHSLYGLENLWAVLSFLLITFPLPSPHRFYIKVLYLPFSYYQTLRSAPPVLLNLFLADLFSWIAIMAHGMFYTGKNRGNRLVKGPCIPPIFANSLELQHFLLWRL